MDTADTRPGLAGALARLARDRDADAWGTLLDLGGRGIRALAYRLSGDRALAEDAVQETLLQLRDSAGRFAPRGGDPDADARRWIAGVAARATLELMRRQRRARRRDANAGRDLPPQPASAPDAEVERSETIDLVRAELSELPEPMRQAVALRHVSGYGIDEVATELRIPVGTAKTRVHRGLARMRTQLERRGVTLSAAALPSQLQSMPAPHAAGSISAHAHLLESQREPAFALPPTTSEGLSMTATFAIAAVGALAIASAPILWSQEHDPAADVAPPVATSATGARTQAAHPATPSGDDAEEVRAAVLAQVRALRQNDLLAFFHTLPDRDQRALRDIWDQQIRADKTGSTDDIAIAVGMVRAPDAARALAPMIATAMGVMLGESQGSLAGAVRGGKLPPSFRLSSQIEATDADVQTTMQELASRVQAWLPTIDLHDAEAARRAAEAVVSAGAAFQIETGEQLRGLTLEQAIERCAPCLAAVKGVCAAYGIDIDRFLDQCIIARIDARGDRRAVTLRFCAFDRDYFVSGGLMERDDDRWVPTPSKEPEDDGDGSGSLRMNVDSTGIHVQGIPRTRPADVASPMDAPPNG
jgi:RNA polymerase sigma-70 factor, ECF subfamily